MTLVRRLVLILTLAVAAVRALAYLIYAGGLLPSPLETFYLEAKMVLLGYRAQVGASLYPRWQDYPHVTNFFGPVYFALLGWLGAAVHADIPALMAIGRAMTFSAALGVTAIVWVVATRRYGRAAGAFGALVTLGSGPLLGFSVMVRPDTTADLFGFGGFLLCGHRARGWRIVGAGLLVLAILTKQTAALYLVAAVLAPVFEREPWRAGRLLVGCGLVLAAVILGVNLFVEPNFVASLLGESKTPWSLANLIDTVSSARYWPELAALPLAGVFVWLRTAPRDVRLATLAVVLLAGSTLASGKIGAAVNYFLCLRGIEGLAAGACWQAAWSNTVRARWAALASTLALCAALQFTLWPQIEGVLVVRRHVANMTSPQGRSTLRVRRSLYQKARDPNVHILTDSGMIDLYQGTRAAFGDPWLFHVMVETGRIDPVLMKQRIDDQYYEMVVTEADLMSPEYAHFDRRLPAVLAERVRARYEPLGLQAGLYFYTPRGRVPR